MMYLLVCVEKKSLVEICMIYLGRKINVGYFEDAVDQRAGEIQHSIGPD
jgi:hypothetical protein